MAALEKQGVLDDKATEANKSFEENVVGLLELTLDGKFTAIEMESIHWMERDENDATAVYAKSSNEQLEKRCAKSQQLQGIRDAKLQQLQEIREAEELETLQRRGTEDETRGKECE